MANIFWYGKNIGLKITNKAANNTGIDSVVASAVSGGSIPFATNTISGEGLTNNGAGVTTDTIATFVAKNAPASGAYETFAANSIQFHAKWHGMYEGGNPANTFIDGGTTDEHILSAAITLCREASSASVAVSKSTVWSDEAMPEFTVSAASESGTPYVTAPTASWASNKTNLTVSGTSNSATPVLATGVSINKSVTATLTATTTKSDNPTNSAAASTNLTANNSVTIKNAAASITLNGESTSTSETSVYVKAGDSKNITYIVNPHISGTVFSDAVVKNIDPTGSATAGTPSSGSITVNGISAGSSRLQLKSTQTSNADGILSSIVNIYVTGGDLTKALNIGDVNADVFAGVGSTFTLSSGGAAYVDVNVNSNGYLVISAKAQTTQPVTITLSSGSVISVTVQHIAVALV